MSFSHKGHGMRSVNIKYIFPLEVATIRVRIKESGGGGYRLEKNKCVMFYALEGRKENEVVFLLLSI